MPDQHPPLAFLEGYLSAIDDVKELLGNAAANGEQQHGDYELIDQLEYLLVQRGI